MNDVVPQDEICGQSEDAETFNGNSPVVMELARDSFMRAQDLDYRRTIENVVETICNIVEADDAQESIRAYLEDREPEW